MQSELAAGWVCFLLFVDTARGVAIAADLTDRVECSQEKDAASIN